LPGSSRNMPFPLFRSRVGHYGAIMEVLKADFLYTVHGKRMLDIISCLFWI